MIFSDRKEAGQLLARALRKYQGKRVTVWGLTRGGVVTAFEIAKELNAPLRAIVVKKVGHPFNPEFAAAAVTENVEVVAPSQDLDSVDRDWLKSEILAKKSEAKEQGELYSVERGSPDQNPIVILADDGAATGLSLRAAIKDRRQHGAEKIVVAVPVAPADVAEALAKEADELVVLYVPADFLGAVGSYYSQFPQVETSEAVGLVKSFHSFTTTTKL